MFDVRQSLKAPKTAEGGHQPSLSHLSLGCYGSSLRQVSVMADVEWTEKDNMQTDNDRENGWRSVHLGP